MAASAGQTPPRPRISGYKVGDEMRCSDYVGNMLGPNSIEDPHAAEEGGRTHRHEVRRWCLLPKLCPVPVSQKLGF